MADDLRGYFEAEARELIDRMTHAVAMLEPGGAPTAVLQDALRAAHTLKGASHVVGERAMGTLAHEFEDGVASYKTEPSREKAASLLGLVDALSAKLEGGAAPPATDPAAPALPNPVESRPDGQDSARPPNPEAPKTQQPAPVSPAPVLSSVASPSPVTPSPGPQSAPAVPSATLPSATLPSAALPHATRQTVRVDLAETAKLLEGVGAGAVLVGSMREVLSRLEALEGTGTVEMRRAERGALRQRLGDDLHRLNRTMAGLSRLASGFRLGSTAGLLLEAGRIVRTTAASLGKPAVCLARGGEERVEMPILDALQDALLHLVRNAVAHGLEPEVERIRLGKPPVATIRVDVLREGTDVVMRCADDGRGIAVEPIRKAAVERGEMSAAQARSATDEDLLRLLFRPGFSLSKSLDQVSGRGVGLDAVQEAAARVGGAVVVQSTVGLGTTFTLRVPQTVFAVESLEVVAGGARYLLPMRSVEQTFTLDKHQIGAVGGTETMLIGRESMTVFPLRRAFGDEQADGESNGRRFGLLVQAEGKRMAIAVDAIGERREVLVYPLPHYAGVAAHVAGASLHANGTPELVLDPAELLRLASSGSVPVVQRLPAASPVQQRPILVIDDSLTTRMLEQSILEAEGYEVEVATSAEQGLEKARKKDYALFVVDVEMPGMSGFDFVAMTRADDKLKETPAILVTSLDSVESRERGRAAGAYSYIVKGEFDQKIYLDRIRSVVGGAA